MGIKSYGFASIGFVLTFVMFIINLILYATDEANESNGFYAMLSGVLACMFWCSDRRGTAIENLTRENHSGHVSWNYFEKGKYGGNEISNSANVDCYSL